MSLKQEAKKVAAVAVEANEVMAAQGAQELFEELNDVNGGGPKVEITITISF